MSRSQDRLSLKRTLGISTVLHLLLAPLFVTSAAIGLGGHGSAGGAGTAETMRVSYVSIAHRAPAPPRAAAMERPVQKPTLAPAHARTVARRPASRASGPDRSATGSEAPGGQRAPGAAGRIAVSIATAAPERAALAVEQHVATPEPVRVTPNVASPVPTATAVPSSPPPQVAEAPARGSDAPPGAWGQSFDKPLVADEAALSDLRSHYHARAAITIDVDEAGHATHVTLPDGLPDDVRAELEKRLRELRYVPAECNGLRCGGTLQITI